jgi:hypothetical protein
MYVYQFAIRLRYVYLQHGSHSLNTKADGIGTVLHRRYRIMDDITLFIEMFIEFTCKRLGNLCVRRVLSCHSTEVVPLLTCWPS